PPRMHPLTHRSPLLPLAPSWAGRWCPPPLQPPSPALACPALCRRWWPYDLRPVRLAQWPHVAGGDQPKACRTRANGIPLVARGQVPVVALDHARVGMAKFSDTTCMGTPFISAKLAYVWRRPWKMIGGGRPGVACE